MRTRIAEWWVRSRGPASEDLGLLDDEAISSLQQDRLTHGPLAGHITDVLHTVRPPLTVGLFGSWGSGKSGLLRLIAQNCRDRRTPVVELDAWKYADSPLARQFLSETAKQLSTWRYRWLPPSFRNRLGNIARTRVSRQLYESKRTRAIAWRGWPSFVFAVLVFLLIFSASVLLLAAVAMFQKESSLEDALRAVKVPGITTSAVAALLGFTLAAFRSDLEVSRPDSEEEFEAALRQVLYRTVGAEGRIVFLVDEVDRCPPPEVMSTLKTIRTFLGVERTVFVVAADREVIEEALEDAPMHATPSDSLSSYSRAGGSFLDKLFQLQFDIPPLTEGRLSEFAAQLLGERGGLWTDLDVSELVGVLLPSHVSSPRRVKVLVNAFALALGTARRAHQLRPAEAVDPEGREDALAKLVVLRTEFPLFAKRLAELPELLPALTQYLTIAETAPVAEIAQAQEELLSGFSPDLARETRAWARLEEPVEVPLPSDREGRAQFKRQRAEELLRYLTRTSDVPNPGRELVFGRSLGQPQGVPPEVASTLEAGVFDGRLREVDEVLENLDAVTLTGVITMLANWVIRSARLDQRRAMESLLKALPEDSVVSTELSELLEQAYEEYAAKNEAPPAWTVPLLRFSPHIPPMSRGRLQTKMLEGTSWRGDSDTVQSVVGLAPRLTADARQTLADVLPELLAEFGIEIVEVTKTLDAQVLTDIWRPAAWIAWQSALDPGEGEIAELAERFAEESDLAWSHLRTLIKEEEPELARHVLAGLGPIDDPEKGLELAKWIREGVIPIGDVDKWAQRLGRARYGPDTAESAAEEVAHVLGFLLSSAESGELSIGAARRLSLGLRDLGLSPPQEMADYLKGPPASWWSTEAGAKAYQESCVLLRDWAESWPDSRGFWGHRASGLGLVLRSPTVVPNAVQSWALAELKEVHPRLNEKWVRSVADSHLPGLSREKALTGETMLRLHLVPVGDPFPGELLDELIESTDPLSDQALASWIERGNPTAKDLIRTVQSIGPSRWSPSLAGAIGIRLSSLKKTAATTLLISLLDSPGPSARLVEGVDPSSVYQSRVAAKLAASLKNARNPMDRKKALAQVNAVGIDSPAAGATLVEAVFDLAGEGPTAATDVISAFPTDLLKFPGVKNRLSALEEKYLEKSVATRIRSAIRDFFG